MCKEFDGDSDGRACGYLRRLVNEIHTVVLATMGDDGYPRTCAVDMMLADRHGVYFLTARGKSLYSRLRATGRVSLTGVRGDTTMTSVAVTLIGDVEEVPERLGELLEANPYMYRIYPTEESRRALTAVMAVSSLYARNAAGVGCVSSLHRITASRVCAGVCCVSSTRASS